VSSGSLLILAVVCPGGVFVVEGAILEAAVQDADEPAGQLAQRGVMAWLRAQLAVVGTGAGGGSEGAESLSIGGSEWASGPGVRVLTGDYH
jgi:hypothetical protein